MKSKKMKVSSRVHGDISIRVDEEDVKLVEGYHIFVKHMEPSAIAKNHNPIVCIRAPGASTSDYQHLSRVILREHNMLDEKCNVFYKNSDSFDLRKKSLSQGKRIFN